MIHSKQLRIGVLMGGKSLEKEVSFNSGRTVCDHLDTTRYHVVPIFQSNSYLYLLPWHFLHRGKTADFEHRLPTEGTLIAWDDLKNHVDFIYIAQHGRYAEDGILQGMLEILNIPYIGSGVFASALRADKIMHKTFLKNAGIVVPRFIIVQPDEIDDFQHHHATIKKKLITAQIYNSYVVKPYNEGSSFGISIVNDFDKLEAALQRACYIEHGIKKCVIIEEKIIGMEFTCITLMDYITNEYRSLMPTEIIPEQGTDFFDYEQKYMPGRGIKRTPAPCSPEIITRIQQTCITAMRALDLTTISRIDGFVTADDTIVIIDPNSLSGMAPSSFIFNQAAHANMSPFHIINHIIETELHYYNLLELTINKKTIELPMTPNKKIRVAILLGGASNEKETSLDSGRNVFYKLSPDTYETIPLFVSSALELFVITQSQLVCNSTQEIVELLADAQKIKWNDLPNIADFVFNALHGGEGENGSVQGALEMLKLPYNGSSVLASSLCINKYKTNQFLAAHGFNVPRNAYITKKEWNKNQEKNILPLALSIFACKNVSKGAHEKNNYSIYPLIVKPHDDGCSVMVQKVTHDDELIIAINKIFDKKDAVLIEEYIDGMELTVGVIGNDTPRALPPSQTITMQGVLSIEEKFLPGAGENQTPAPLPSSTLQFIQRTIENVYKTVGCKGYARIDCFYQSAELSSTDQEQVIIIEINTLPGLTPATCLFHQSAEIGLRPMEFIDTIIKLGFEQHQKYTSVTQAFTHTYAKKSL